MKKKRQWIYGVTFLILAGLVPAAGAVSINVDLNENLAHHNDVFTVNFSLDSDRLVSFFTSSWDDGGFDTALFLWDAAGNWLGFPSGYSDDNGIASSVSYTDPLGAPHSFDYGENDVFLNTFLGAGDYTATFLMTGNVPVGFPFTVGNLADGFAWDSTPPVSLPNGQIGLHMWGISNYSIPGGSMPIPEPATVTLLALGGSLLAARRRIHNE